MTILLVLRKVAIPDFNGRPGRPRRCHGRPGRPRRCHGRPGCQECSNGRPGCQECSNGRPGCPSGVTDVRAVLAVSRTSGVPECSNGRPVCQSAVTDVRVARRCHGRPGSQAVSRTSLYCLVYCPALVYCPGTPPSTLLRVHQMLARCHNEDHGVHCPVCSGPVLAACPPWSLLPRVE